MEERDARFIFARAVKCADAGDGDSGDAAGDASLCRGGEEEFVVFSSVECGGEGLFGRELLCEGVEGDGRGVELCAEVGGFAEVSEVGGEAVAEVDGGVGETATEEGGSDSESGLRVEVWV
jgi:hypothetical protein